MCSLDKFPDIPPHGQVNVCEVDGKVHPLSFDTATHCEIFTNAVSKHPNVCISKEIGPSSKCNVSGVFVASKDALAKQLITTWYEKGLFSAIVVLRSSHAPIILRKSASFLLQAYDAISQIGNKFQPRLKEKGENLTALVSECREWSMSPVRCLDWHPQYTKLAVGVCNDCVRIYSVDSQLIPVLKCQQQVAVSCLAWRPFSASEIAVGCQNGVLVWTVDPSSVSARPSASCARHLHRPGHGPVTSVAWSPQGDLLVTASAADSTMYVWSPEQQHSVPLRRIGGGGVCIVHWSPLGNRLFASTAGVIFRVWSTRGKWAAERWNTQRGRVQSACWSPCGSILLFATTADPFVYCLRFGDTNTAFGSEDFSAAQPVIDLTPVNISESGERAGGLVVKMAWDKTGRYLAVICRDSSVVTLFRTSISVLLTLTPCCHVNGLPGEVPSTITFQKNFEDGAVLTIAWSMGRLQHFPIISYDLEGDVSSISAGKSRNLSSTRLTNVTNISRLY